MNRTSASILLALGALALASCGEPTASGTGPDTNQVSYWCPGGGIKIEPAATPFVVPAPPAGYSWTLLVLKAGSGPGENEQFPNPVVGQSYQRSDGKGISHAILCQSQTTTTTSTSSTTTTSTTTTSTTLPPTPNTFGVPGGSTTTTESPLQTTSTAPTPATSSGSPQPTTTVPGIQTTTTQAPTPPITGPATVQTTAPPPPAPSPTIPATR